MKYKNLSFTVTFICLFFISCNKSNNNKEALDNYSLVKNTNKTHVFQVESNVHYETPTLFHFEDKDGNKYLTFQNGTENEILFYNMDSSALSFKVIPEMEGPKGVGRFFGYHVEDFDQIYLTIPERSVIFKINKNGDILQKIDYGENKNKETIIPFFLSSSAMYTPLIIIQDKFYFTQIPNFSLTLTTSPASGYVDTLTHDVRLLPFYYPPIMERKDGTMGDELCFSRIFDGNRFVYSFYLDEYLYSTSIDHLEVRKMKASSKYISNLYKPQKRPDDMKAGLKKLCEIAIYGNLVYDKYRNVYYRIAYPGVEMEDEVNYLEIYRTGRKKFSIIILDENLNVVGETLFPEYTYISNTLFVNEDGLHIRANHSKNPEFNEDAFIFDCFELTKKPKRK
jgi:hypothetical protein